MVDILVVDDDDRVTTLLARVLREEGHGVETAANGDEALESAAAREFDIVILDLVMPEKEGLETLVELRRRDPTLKVLAISGAGGVANQAYLEAAALLGADATLPKPFHVDELVDAVSLLVEEGERPGPD